MIPRHLQIAFGELWPSQVKEIVGPGSNPRILEYHATTSLKATSDDVAWCSAFVNWSVIQASLKGTNDARARSWLAWGVRADYPEPGTVAIMTRAGVYAGPTVLDAPGHVGLVVGLAEGNSVDVLGGNQGDAVSIERFPLARVLGFRMPASAGGG